MDAEEIGRRLDEIYKAVADICYKDSRCYKCCVGCASKYGFFESPRVPSKPGTRGSLTDDPEAMRQLEGLQLKYGWSSEKGFLGDSGCKLPRSLRSVHCQDTDCYIIKPLLKDKDGLLIKLREIRMQAGNLI